jgi:hypothetical protein
VSGALQDPRQPLASAPQPQGRDKISSQKLRRVNRSVGIVDKDPLWLEPMMCAGFEGDDGVSGGCEMRP